MNHLEFLKWLIVDKHHPITRGDIMSDINKILVAIAFSKDSSAIFEYAAKLASDLDAQLVVTNVINIRDIEAISSVESLGYSVSTDDYKKDVKKEREAQLGEMATKISFPKEKMQTIIKVGHPFEALLKIVKEESVDMVVMGTKGRTDLEYVMLGSVADKMLRHSPVPVVSFRKK
jgi:nucleotide-binding universal stress UspA family protein